MTKPRPYLITDNEAEGEELHGVPVRDKLFDELWLQKMLFKHPSILPIELVDEDFGPLVPIGREIASIDNLFISPKGLLTIVETKLWRNPEAHRTVVAQILDYAKVLATWSYKDLDDAVQGCRRASAALRFGEDQACSRRRRSLAAVIRIAVLASAPAWRTARLSANHT